LFVCVAGALGYYFLHAAPSALVLTGIVTTNDVIVSPQVGGQVDTLLVRAGDTVRKDELLGRIAPAELRADTRYYAHNAAGETYQVQEAEDTLRYQELQTADQIRQAEANLAASEAQEREGEADLERARLDLERDRGLARDDVVSPQQLDQARTAYDAARAHVDTLRKQVDAGRAALAAARANAEQVAIRRSRLLAARQELAAAAAERNKADVRLAYTEMRAPIDGIVDVRAVRPGEIVNPGQAVVTLINPDDLWVRADVEETYIDRIRLGEHLTVRLPSGQERQGTVFFRGVDAAFATQRDVSRIKRDIKTFEVRLRVDNRDRALAPGMTAYVLLPLA
jgi:multidrug resistance efflux pump